MNLSQIEFLISDTGKHLLEKLADEDLSDARTLTLLTSLRKTYTSEQTAAALETARLRLKAREKFGSDAAKMLFTRNALEQASDPAVRRYRAAHHAALKTTGTALDLCCGIGADTLALAEAAQHETVLGLDYDPVRIAIARHNASVLGLTNAHFEVADVTDLKSLAVRNLQFHGEGFRLKSIFFDPARRDDSGKRIYDVERYIPPLSLIKDWLPSGAPIMVKLSPGVDLDQLRPYSGYVEFISVDGDLKEAVLHLNQPAHESSNHYPYSATLLTQSGEPLRWTRTFTPESRLSGPRGWLIEPDAALIRAGLVQDAAQQFDGTQLDDLIAYFTTDTKPDSPWIRAWKIVDWMPFNLKKLRAYLREHGVGRVTVKKRGSPLEPEALIAQLKLKGGSESRTLVLTQHVGKPIVIVCEDYRV